jgi:transposase InsO family protein
MCWIATSATAPNQKWVADFTYIWTSEGWLYVAAVLDLFSRRMVGWSMQPTMTSQLVTGALLMALRRRGPADVLLHHSDPGSQGGFNRSSQHLMSEVCDDEDGHAKGESLYEEKITVTWGAV